MGNPYPMLTYPGDILRDDVSPVGGLLGMDEAMRPYEVIDVTICREGDESNPGDDCSYPERYDTHSHVFLQYAKPETLKTPAAQRYLMDMTLRGLVW